MAQADMAQLILFLPQIARRTQTRPRSNPRSIDTGPGLSRLIGGISSAARMRAPSWGLMKPHSSDSGEKSVSYFFPGCSVAYERGRARLCRYIIIPLSPIPNWRTGLLNLKADDWIPMLYASSLIDQNGFVV
jgi:hypothetical protein